MDKIRKFIDYVKAAKEELNKVIFPTPQEVKQSFIAVALMVTVIALFLSMVDLIMSSVLKAVL